ncbi:hypothetical protein [Streptomyces zagrosensis]|uniref:Lipoprotein n=1 Tax=Streptomyces zagrosensis TaxID=1042984 RepID=A0A7W9V1H8_9ACTN|nr:hypothetical protein [Streptomyces zagrosensis]MBB5939288.1 hypothetical protein [Streptomyces zagrosensis]
MTIRRCLRPHAVIVYALALLLWATGCTSQDASSSPASTPSPLKGSELAKVRGSLTEQKRLFQAEQELRAACMAQRGQVYRPARWHRPSPPDPTQDPRRGDDVELRRRHGYGAAPSEASPQAGRDPNAAHLRSLSKSRQQRYGHALSGTPQHRISVRLPDRSVAFMNEDGCVARTEKHLYGDLRTWLKAQMVAINVETEVLRLVSDDKRLRHTEEPWRRCMRESGHTYRTPEAARTAATAVREETEKSKSTRGKNSKVPEDIAIAVADAQCDRHVGRAKLVRSLDHHYRDQVARTRSEEIVTYRTLRTRGLISLGSGPPSY